MRNDPESLAVDPATLLAVAAHLSEAARSLRAALPGLRAAWAAAALAMGPLQTGQAMTGSGGSALAAAEGCVEAVEALTTSLRRAAATYSSSESAAVPGQRKTQRKTP